MAPVNRYETSAPHKALAHPLRARMFALMTGTEMSPKMVSDELGEPLGNIAYHMKVLLHAELIEQSGVQPRRGAVEHFYRVVDDDGALPVMRLSRELADQFVVEFRELVERTREASADGAAEVEMVVAAHRIDLVADDEESLWCENGEHHWVRAKSRGRKPLHCDKHR